MISVIGVRFRRSGKIYYFDPAGHGVQTGDKVIVETVRGLEYGAVDIVERQIDEMELISPLKPVLRLADEKDHQQDAENRGMAEAACVVFREKILEYELEMSLVDTEYTFDRNKLIFYFTADGRIDFRELVKDLAAVFRTRIELRQIGVRDEAKNLGGLGCCGRPLCCASWMGDFQSVSIKMAKDQGLSLNPTKISGACGRLFCCLKYEHHIYETLLKEVPGVGSIVKTPDGKGRVIESAVLAQTLKVQLDDPGADAVEIKSYPSDQVVTLKAARKQKNDSGRLNTPKKEEK